MKFLSQIFDFMFAPAGAFDAESSFLAASSGSTFGQVDATKIKSATSFPMIEGTGVDVGESVFGLDVHRYDQSDARCVCSAETESVHQGRGAQSGFGNEVFCGGQKD